MDPQKLTSLLRATAGGPRDRTPDCPGEELLASYVDGALEPAEAEQLEMHLADCDPCVAVVVFLSREHDKGLFKPVPETDLARARQLVKPVPSRWTRFAPPGWAAAAMVLISILAVTQYSRLSGVDVGPQVSPGERTTRSAFPGRATLQVLAPGAGAIVDEKRLAFRWSEIPGSRYYDVRIVTDTGDLVAEERVTGTEWRPADSISLKPGTEYFVHIDAYPSKAKTVSSDHVPFSVSARP